MSTQTLPLVASTPARRWYGLFIPSLADLFFVSVIVWAFAAGNYGWYGLLMDGDVGTHIRIGDYIVEHRTVPTHDFLAFSKPGQEWYAFEWLTEVIFSFLHGVAGLKGVVLLSGLVIASAFTILLLHALWRGANALVSLALVLMAVNATNVHFHARPHIFTLLFVALALWLISVDRQRRSWAVWLLVPITAVWTNLHGGFVVLFAFLGLLVVGSFAESLLWGELSVSGKSDAVRYSLLGIACAAASLINPYGLKLHLFLLDYLRSDTIRNRVGEFQSPIFRGESMFHFMIILFAGLAITGPLLRKHKLTEVLWIGFMAYNALVSVRHVPLFLIVTIPILAAQLTAWWNQYAQAQPARSIARTLDEISGQCSGGSARLTVWIPAVALALALSHGSNWPQNFYDGPYPVKIVEAHAAEIADSRVYTSDKWAGYLIYKNYPRQRVFFDDRHHYFGDAIISDYLKLGAGVAGWREVLDRYQFGMVLCPADSALASLLRTQSDWKTVEQDEDAVLFRKTS